MSETHKEKHCCSSLNLNYAHFLLRGWVGLRLFMAGVDKFRAGAGDEVTYSMENYNKKSELIAKLMAENSLLPSALCGPYANGIGFALVIVGLWTLVGLATDLALLAAGLIFLSLGFGLAALPDDTEVVYIGISVIATAFALATSKHRKLSLDGILFRKKH